jgi:radical SAM protein with 4Fe4S-binding SPASM domain
MFERVYVEISNICNLQCDFCPAVLRDKKIMSTTDFEKILLQLKGKTKEVCLHLMGEPLGHPHLEEVFKIATEVGIPVNFTTNGVLLNNIKNELLLQKIVRQVNISIHSFEANHKEKDVSPYMEKVFRFTDLAFEQRPDMYINYRIWDLADPLSISPKNKMIRDLIEQKFNFDFSQLKIDIRRQKGYKILNRLYVNFDSRFEWPSMQQPVRSDKGFCHALSHHVGIHADGSVVPCCLDKEADLKLGNCLENSLEDVLLSPRAKAMSAGFAKKILVESLCQKCDYAKRFDRKKTNTQSKVM